MTLFKPIFTIMAAIIAKQKANIEMMFGSNGSPKEVFHIFFLLLVEKKNFKQLVKIENKTELIA